MVPHLTCLLRPLLVSSPKALMGSPRRSCTLSLATHSSEARWKSALGLSPEKSSRRTTKAMAAVTASPPTMTPAYPAVAAFSLAFWAKEVCGGRRRRLRFIVESAGLKP